MVGKENTTRYRHRCTTQLPCQKTIASIQVNRIWIRFAILRGVQTTMHDKEPIESLKELFLQQATDLLKQGVKSADLFEPLLFVAWAAGLNTYRQGMPSDAIFQIEAEIAGYALGLMDESLK
jgi:hypothetical protein